MNPKDLWRAEAYHKKPVVSPNFVAYEEMG
jgi:hypothetical protein